MPTPTVQWPFKPDTRQAAPRKLLRASDGDTPLIEQPVRMVSCDTPEKAGYAGKAETAQRKLNECRTRLKSGFYSGLPKALRDYLIAKLTDDAAQRHINAGNRASVVFDELLERRLTRDDGKKRSLAIIPTGQIMDVYSRLLAYFSPYFAGTKSDPLPPRGDPARRTFNLDMIENGWAAFFPVYPSLPRIDEMNTAIQAAEIAWKKKRGAWKEFGKDLLLAYEYRMCIKLGEAKTAKAGIDKAFERVCVDLRNMKIVGEFGFSSVPPPYRLWVWQDEEQKAKIDLGLKP